ncbi:DNA-binding transcriptional regulator, LysR family [Duganella sacchari]|uniref:DNA-binding transcriptional regulator, LysR family n=1 Tax=Duganella sacchari TaxID=551987 RepID=A0A1M7MZY9_9BURK|nr:LysR family transcriptional regulator [Duganella sacchari]SHM96677.1 DNA-binding transcriptional regulator, LysR family [Duganella sacchari]
MTLEQLRIFIAVAEREHLTQAADALALTPSAVSASIRALEERYDTPLFHRMGRGIQLNDAGRLFLAEARATLAAARNAELTLAELAGLQRGALAVHASQTIASYWLPPLLLSFHQQYPLITLSLTIGNTSSVAQAVREGMADLGLVEDGVDEQELASTTVAQDDIVAVVAPAHPWADGRAVDADALRDAEWIMREPGSGTRSAFEARLAAMGIMPSQLRVALDLPSNEAVRSAVLAGPYAAVVSELVVAPHLQAGLLRKVNLDLPPRPFSLLHHRQRHQSRAAQALTELLKRPAS